MKIIISARPGAGKTTLVKELATQIKAPKCGFYTEEILKDRNRAGFKAISLDGRKEVILAHVDIKSPYRVGKYKVNIKDFEPMAINILEQALKDDEAVVIIDEIGKMELFSPKFKQLVLELLNSPKTVIFTIKSDWARDWIAKIKDSDIRHFELIRSNFQEILKKILDILPE